MALRRIVQYLPAVRLSRLAQQLLQVQPNPPRDASFAAAWSVYAPTVVYQSIGWVLLSMVVVAVSPERSRAALAVAFTVVFMVQLLVWLALAARLRSVLRNGVEATAVVVRMSTASSIPRVEVNGHVIRLRGATARRLRVGDRVRVMTNPSGDRIWISLEGLTT